MFLRILISLLIGNIITAPALANVSPQYQSAEYHLHNSTRVDHFAEDIAVQVGEEGSLTLVLPEGSRVSYELRRLIERLNRHKTNTQVLRVSKEKYQQLLAQSRSNDFHEGGDFDVSNSKHLGFSKPRLIRFKDLVSMAFGVQHKGVFWDHVLEQPTKPFPAHLEALPDGPLKRLYQLKHRLTGKRKYAFDSKLTFANVVKNLIYLVTFLPIALTQKSLTDLSLWKPIIARSAFIWFFGYQSREMNDIFAQRISASIKPENPKKLKRSGVETGVSNIRLNQGYYFTSYFLFAFVFGTFLLWLFQGSAFGMESIVSSAMGSFLQTFAFMPFGKMSITLHGKSRLAYRELEKAEIPALYFPDSKVFHEYLDQLVVEFSAPNQHIHLVKRMVEKEGVNQIEFSIRKGRKAKEGQLSQVYREFHPNGVALRKEYEKNLYLQQLLSMSLRIIGPALSSLFLYLDSSAVLMGVPIGQLKEKPLEFLGTLGLIYDVFINRFAGLHNMTSETLHFANAKRKDFLVEMSRRLGFKLSDSDLSKLENAKTNEALLLLKTEQEQESYEN